MESGPEKNINIKLEKRKGRIKDDRKTSNI
jgi:hypothetical protein